MKVSLSKRPVNLNRRMRYLHPYELWRRMVILYASNHVRGVADPHFSPEDLGEACFTNWQELTENQRNLVILCKIRYPMGFLVHHRRILEKTHVERVPRYRGDYSEPKVTHLGVFQPRPPIFGDFTRFGMDPRATEFEAMDEAWGKWINRREISLVPAGH